MSTNIPFEIIESDPRKMYATQQANIRDIPSTDGNILGKLTTNQEVLVTGYVKQYNNEKCLWYKLQSYINQNLFVNGGYLVLKPINVLDKQSSLTTPTVSPVVTPVVTNTNQVKTPAPVQQPIPQAPQPQAPQVQQSPQVPQQQPQKPAYVNKTTAVNGIKSKDRVKEQGEVFTPDSIVNDMLDLVDNEETLTDIDYINRTYLEPACGDGQFLVRILYRKLLRVQNLPIEQRQIGLIKSLASIYGVDIMADNVKEAHNRMFDIATGQQVSTFDLNNQVQIIQINLGLIYTEQLKNVINYILDKNIINGNTLNDNIEFTSYHFNDTNGKVSLAKAQIQNLELEYDKTDEMDIMDIVNVSDGNKEIEDFDF